MNQASQEYDGKQLKRWYVYTDRGRKIAWAETAAKAEKKLLRKVREVFKVEPAPGMGE